MALLLSALTELENKLEHPGYPHKALRLLAFGPYHSKKKKVRGLYSSVALHYTIKKKKRTDTLPYTLKI